MVGLKNWGRDKPVIQIHFPLFSLCMLPKIHGFLLNLYFMPLSFIFFKIFLPVAQNIVFTLIPSSVWTLHGEACQNKPQLYCFFVWIHSTWYISSEMYVCRLMGKLIKLKLKLTALKLYATLSIWTTSHEHFTGFVSGLWTVTQWGITSELYS